MILTHIAHHFLFVVQVSAMVPFKADIAFVSKLSGSTSRLKERMISLTGTVNRFHTIILSSKIYNFTREILFEFLINKNSYKSYVIILQWDHNFSISLQTRSFVSSL